MLYLNLSRIEIITNINNDDDDDVYFIGKLEVSSACTRQLTCSIRLYLLLRRVSTIHVREYVHKILCCDLK